jgi:hypothetical protein
MRHPASNGHELIAKGMHALKPTSESRARTPMHVHVHACFQARKQYLDTAHHILRYIKQQTQMTYRW